MFCTFLEFLIEIFAWCTIEIPVGARGSIDGEWHTRLKISRNIYDSDLERTSFVENALDLVTVVDVGACDMVRAWRLRADQNRDVPWPRLQCHCHAESSWTRDSRRCRFYFTNVQPAHSIRMQVNALPSFIVVIRYSLCSCNKWVYNNWQDEFSRKNCSVTIFMRHIRVTFYSVCISY